MHILKTLALFCTAILSVHAAPRSTNSQPPPENNLQTVNGTAELTSSALKDLSYCVNDRYENCRKDLDGELRVKSADCARAVSKINLNRRYIRFDEPQRFPEAGECAGSCILYVDGNRHDRHDRKDRGDLSGGEMIAAYNEVKKCRTCGLRKFDDGCLFRMEWYWDCKWVSG